MKDFLINEQNYDLELVNFDLSFTSDMTRYVAQKLRIKLAIFLNEWYLNINIGLPYQEIILVKNPDIDYIEDLYKLKILEVEEVDKIIDFETVTDTSTRELIVSFTAQLINGEELSLTI